MKKKSIQENYPVNYPHPYRYLDVVRGLGMEQYYYHDGSSSAVENSQPL
jgi:hypothetical protein